MRILFVASLLLLSTEMVTANSVDMIVITDNHAPPTIKEQVSFFILELMVYQLKALVPMPETVLVINPKTEIPTAELNGIEAKTNVLKDVEFSLKIGRQIGFNSYKTTRFSRNTFIRYAGPLIVPLS